jgi:hypothetical protein
VNSLPISLKMSIMLILVAQKRRTTFLLPLLNSAPMGWNHFFCTFLIYPVYPVDTFPSKWKDSFFIPIFKTGKRNDVDTYRGVAILSFFENLFEVIVYCYIYFSVKSSIMSAQHGFFKGRSTVKNLIEFTSYVLNCMENGVQVDAMYTDFSKAFDKVSHRLLAKLGFGSFLAWIRSYFISFPFI